MQTFKHPAFFPVTRFSCRQALYRLVGLVVKASASRVEDPGFDPGLRSWIISGSSHASELKMGYPGAALPGAWRFRISAGTGWPGVSIL